MPRPPGLRLVALDVTQLNDPGVDLPRTDATPTELIAPPLEPLPEAFWRVQGFEFVHDACPRVDSFIETLRASPPTEAMLTVYSDWLVQQGELVRGEFAGVAARRLSAERDQRAELTLRLRELRHGLPSSWCRVVLGAA